MTPLPCPFCGETLKPVYDLSGLAVVSYSHAAATGGTDYCIMQGHSIGVALMPAWQRRSGPAPERPAFKPARAFATDADRDAVIAAFAAAPLIRPQRYVHSRERDAT